MNKTSSKNKNFSDFLHVFAQRVIIQYVTPCIKSKASYIFAAKHVFP